MRDSYCIVEANVCKEGNVTAANEFMFKAATVLVVASERLTILKNVINDIIKQKTIPHLCHTSSFPTSTSHLHYYKLVLFENISEALVQVRRKFCSIHK